MIVHHPVLYALKLILCFIIVHFAKVNLMKQPLPFEVVVFDAHRKVVCFSKDTFLLLCKVLLQLEGGVEDGDLHDVQKHDLEPCRAVLGTRFVAFAPVVLQSLLAEGILEPRVLFLLCRALYFSPTGHPLAQLGRHFFVVHFAFESLHCCDESIRQEGRQSVYDFIFPIGAESVHRLPV